MTKISMMALSACCGFAFLANAQNPTQYVDPFIGTSYNGHAFPGPCMPSGLVQPSPETGNFDWKYISGYNYDDREIWHFAQTHISGTGVFDLGDVAFIPFTGSADKKSFKSSFKKDNESAEIGLYKVYLDDAKSEVKISATEKVAIYEIRFDADDGGLYFDFQSGLSTGRRYDNRVKSSEIRQVGLCELTGAQRVRCWVERDVFFDIVFDRPITAMDIIAPKPPRNGDTRILRFDLKKGDILKVKIAISAVSIDGARANMKAELSGWDFDNVVAQNKAAWRALFDRVRISGDEGQLKNFYTSMYHALIHPANMADTDGKYRGADGKIAQAKNGKYYSLFSLWDTYRAAHPLYTIVTPEKVDDYVNSMLDHFDAQGYLPIWVLWGKENHCMIGNHSISVIAEAYIKGFKGFDPRRALNAMVVSSSKKLRKTDGETFEKYGYYPFDFYKNESVSRTLECCYDDYAVAKTAQKLGDTAVYERFKRRSEFYRNLFDSETKLMRGKDSKGNWREPFDALALSHASTMGGDYTEGNARQYVWHVQHEPEELIKMMGGADAFCGRLDDFFADESKSANQKEGFVSDVTGLIGQYAHGNEPCHHVVYLYALAGQKWRTQELVREVFDKFYFPKTDGLCGNDDCGQMSAWLIFSALGFYPVDPVSAEYVIGAPQIPEATISLPNGHTFKMTAKNLSAANKYVKSVKLNGKIFDGVKIKHSDIINGGFLEFEMTDKPVK